MLFLNVGVLQIMGTLAEIQERHDAVRELERKLLELQQVLYTFLMPFDGERK